MKFCAKILPMSRTRLTIKISSCKMDTNGNFDAAEYVNRNFDDFEDGWGIDLSNLEIATEEEMKKILPTLIREADKKKKKNNRQELLQTMESETKKNVKK